MDRLADTGNDWPRLHSLLISQRGDIIYERYFNRHSPDDLDNVKSVSKSILSVLLGIAIDRGDISGLEATLEDFFADEIQRVHSREKANITLEYLLTMQSGLRTTSSANYGAWIATENWIDAVLIAPMQSAPGQEMTYSTGNSHLISAILTRATGRSTLEYARDVLAAPLGFELAPWPRDPQGIYFGGNDMEMTPRQLLTIGELYLNEGRFNGRQIVSSEWIRESLTPHVRSKNGRQRCYGYGWWLANLMGHDVPHAWGHGGQFLMLVPALDLVLVSTSSASPAPAAYDHANQVYGMLQRLIRAVATHSSIDRDIVASRR